MPILERYRKTKICAYAIRQYNLIASETIVMRLLDLVELWQRLMNQWQVN